MSALPFDPSFLKLSPYVNAASKALLGVSPTDFRYETGVTPLSTWPIVIAGTIGYLASVFGGQYLMKNREAMRLDKLFLVHNIILVVLSGGLLWLYLEELVPMLWTKGLYYAMCDASAYTQNMEFVYYVNYIIKWVEFVDTWFLVAKKKKLEFLHVYHHALTMVLCHAELEGRVVMSWIVITLNLFVHVIMYTYYALTALKIHPWWKQYVTTLQITQFVIDLGFCYSNTWTHFAFNYFPHLPNYGACSATDFAAIFGCGLLSTYLYLFVEFFQKTYAKYKSGKKTSKAGGDASNGKAEGKKTK
ncbi:fatty acid elongase [Gonapodya prolifera JEL478]|uniref:Elongation of fatty acids protein n=1 Tax=Gonapodya prolifera (strain JEL478) TaxID=1344416 RepID=A0A139AMW8_GONPJ|nr:fatty acid elongase [Gonapodya prolifera JEL478]|eukprot:KXS18110.1 fatty acid elongase [Gonapodya prolifera JEL478]